VNDASEALYERARREIVGPFLRGNMKNQGTQGTRSLGEVFYTIGGISITVEQVMDLLLGALEGGSNYWYYIPGFQEPSDMSKVPAGEFNSVELCAWSDGHIKICDKEAFYDHQSGNSQEEPQRWILNEEAMKKGLDLMHNQHIKHFADFVIGDGDANTADVFLQMCLFGELVYG